MTAPRPTVHCEEGPRPKEVLAVQNPLQVLARMMRVDSKSCQNCEMMMAGYGNYNWHKQILIKMSVHICIRDKGANRCR